MENEKWRFPASGHGERKGISSGDIEAFKKHQSNLLLERFYRILLMLEIQTRNLHK